MGVRSGQGCGHVCRRCCSVLAALAKAPLGGVTRDVSRLIGLNDGFHCQAVLAGFCADTGGVDGDRVDFFVSHAGADRAWAEWVAWQLADAGYRVELDVWDWAAGRNFVTAISDALERCDRVVALFSAAYFDPDRYTTEEWSA